MGTYYTYGTGDMSPIEFLRSEMDNEKHKIIDHSIRGNVAYLACQVTRTDGTPEVYGLVCLLHKDGDSRGYKPIEESMGPYHHDCPKRILDKLTPTDDVYSNKWRNACREKISSKKRIPKLGDSLVLASPLKFSDGAVEDTFTVTTYESRGKTKKAYRAKNGCLYRISRLTEREFSLV